MISMGVLVFSKEKSLKLEMDNREYSDANVLNTNGVQARVDSSSLELKQMNMNASFQSPVSKILQRSIKHMVSDILSFKYSNRR